SRPRASGGYTAPDGAVALRRRPSATRMRAIAHQGYRLRRQPARRPQRQGRQGSRDHAPDAAKTRLLAQIEAVRRQHRVDLEAGAGWVAVPDALARKYPNAGRELGWQWVFPATRHYMERLTGQRRRHHLHES